MLASIQLFCMNSPNVFIHASNSYTSQSIQPGLYHDLPSINPSIYPSVHHMPFSLTCIAFIDHPAPVSSTNPHIYSLTNPSTHWSNPINSSICHPMYMYPSIWPTHLFMDPTQLTHPSVIHRPSLHVPVPIHLTNPFIYGPNPIKSSICHPSTLPSCTCTHPSDQPIHLWIQPNQLIHLSTVCITNPANTLIIRPTLLPPLHPSSQT